MRQYSPSRVGRIGPPILVIISMPSAVMERTISPSVSMCAHKHTCLSLLRPLTGTMTLPLLLLCGI